MLIVDDGSTPPLDPALGAGHRFPVTVLRLQPNRGRAAACNLGLARARGRVVLVLDDDMSVPPSLLQVHGRLHRERDLPRAIVGRIDPDPAFFRGRFGRFLARQEQLRHERLAAQGEELDFSECLTGHFSIERDALLGAGGYDEGFSRYGFEDIELAFRLAHKGVRLVYESEVATLHRSEFATFAEHCRRQYDAGQMAVRFAKKYPDSPVPELLRVEGMPWGKQKGWFRRVMAGTHGLARSCPPGITPALLAAARGKVRLLEILAPAPLLHLNYHLVRDMHYAAGIAAARSGESP